MLMSQTLNPFRKTLFDKIHFRGATNPALDEYKYLEIPDPRLQRSVLRRMRQGTDFTPQGQAIVDQLMEDIRDRMDIPFDELYHKERALI
jgi:hypothetical protein